MSDLTSHVVLWMREERGWVGREGRSGGEGRGGEGRGGEGRGGEGGVDMEEWMGLGRGGGGGMNLT